MDNAYIDSSSNFARTQIDKETLGSIKNITLRARLISSVYMDSIDYFDEQEKKIHGDKENNPNWVEDFHEL